VGMEKIFMTFDNKIKNNFCAQIEPAPYELMQSALATRS